MINNETKVFFSHYNGNDREQKLESDHTFLHAKQIFPDLVELNGSGQKTFIDVQDELENSVIIGCHYHTNSHILKEKINKALFPNKISNNRAMNWFMDESLIPFTGRHFCYGQLSLFWIMYCAGVRQFFIKSVDKDFHIITKKFNDGLTRNELMEKITYLLGYRNCYGSGLFVCQEYIPIHYEYRFIVINGRIVSGAGVIEEYTPEDNPDDIMFHHSVRVTPWKKIRKPGFSEEEYYINEEDTHTKNNNPIELFFPKKTFEAYLKMATNITSILQDNGVLHYSIDIGTTDGYNAVLIEINPFLNLGLYANSPKYYLQALKEMIQYNRQEMATPFGGGQKKTHFGE